MWPALYCLPTFVYNALEKDLPPIHSLRVCGVFLSLCHRVLLYIAKLKHIVTMVTVYLYVQSRAPAVPVTHETTISIGRVGSEVEVLVDWIGTFCRAT